ncbi:MAG: heparinase II/III family protein [Bacteroidota bacterium]
MKELFLALFFPFLFHMGAFAQDETNESGLLLAPLPELLVSEDGRAISSASEWEEFRREEVLELFRDHMYGRIPDTEFSISHQVKFMDREALEGRAVQKEVELLFSNGSDSLDISVLVYLPREHTGPVPIFVGLNFYGNHTIHPDQQIGIHDSWVQNNEEFGITDNQVNALSRGMRSHRWPVELILSRGYGLATIYYGDIDPDFDDGFKNGIHGLEGESGAERSENSWGSIAAWAWGLSRAMDYFEEDLEIDAGRVAVIGHSRLGKTSLWAGAQDERFALVISNNSGCGGAALSRRAYGERVSNINTAFPHWFAEKFKAYNDNEAALPVDQHMLMALMAPRPLYVASAEEDNWADQHGEYLSLYYSSPVYELYGLSSLENDRLPEVNQPRWKESLGYHMRTGKHELTSYDWEQFLDFADKHLPQASGQSDRNPVTMEWISENLQKSSPRLILTPEAEAVVQKKLDAGDRLTTMGFELLRQQAESILSLDPLVYNKQGRRLLGVSREAIRRLTTLALVYRFEPEDRYLQKLEQELKAVCSFGDWNPSHFLDVAEMAAGIALALDWAGEWLSPEVKELARLSLVEKALKPGIASSDNNFFIHVHHNWNLVCNGGLSLAALAVFEEEPELASAVLNQAVMTIPLALEPYAPGGIYPEGASYWFYATKYLTLAISAYETALGRDFDPSAAPGIMESAVFSQVLAGPSGKYYNYFDASLGGFHSLAHFGLLAWFSGRSGDPVDWHAYEKLLEEELKDPRYMKATRFFSTHFLNCALQNTELTQEYRWPEVWSGGGEEPIVVFRDRENDRDAFFLAAKGGRAADNHGNMDAGSFIFELDGVRWSLDPGNQNYNELEQLLGMELWNNGQESKRWSLLTKNNFGHSTLTVNGEMHRVDGRVALVGKDIRSACPEFTFGMTPLYGGALKKAERSFARPSASVLRIRDELIFSDKTKNLSWQMITRADVKIEKDRVILRQEGKQLLLTPVLEVPYELNVVELSPPPLDYDKDIPGLKRIELLVERESFSGNAGEIVIELSADARK